MKLIIAGGRDLKISLYTVAALVSHFGIKPTEIVSGKCKTGVDRAGELYADMVDLPVKPFEVTDADWKTIGLKAGPLRNKAMAEYGDALLLIWDGKSRGSGSMKRQMLFQRKPIYEVILNSIPGAQHAKT